VTDSLHCSCAADRTTVPHGQACKQTPSSCVMLFCIPAVKVVCFSYLIGVVDARCLQLELEEGAAREVGLQHLLRQEAPPLQL
jgi:hypothetical protein